MSKTSILLRVGAVSLLAALVIVPGYFYHSNANDAEASASLPTFVESSATYTAENDVTITPVSEGDTTVTDVTAIDKSLSVARDLAEKQQFSDALDVLEAVSPSDKDNYDVKFLQARILAWSGEHYTAEQEFVALREQYPQDSDITVSYAYLQFYQNKFIKAERLFSEVLDKHQDNQDAINGLNRVRVAQVQ